MNIDKRIEKNTISLVNLKKLLLNICKEPANYISFKDILKSQGAVSKYSNVDLEISPTSINTIKRLSVSIFENGFEDFDKLRVCALSAIETFDSNQNKVISTTKKGILDKFSDLEKNNQLLVQSNFELLEALQRTMLDLKAIKKLASNKDVDSYINDSMKKLLIFINNNNLEKNNIVPLFGDKND